MERDVLEKIREDIIGLRKNAIQYLTEEMPIFEPCELSERDTYDIFTVFLSFYVLRLHENIEEAACLPAAITTSYAMSLGWMDSKFNAIGKEFMGIHWGRTPDGGTYSRYTYSEEEQQEINDYLARHEVR